MTGVEHRQNLVRDVMQARDGARLAQPAIADRPPRSWPRSFARKVAFNTQLADLRIQAGKLRLIRRARAGRLAMTGREQRGNPLERRLLPGWVDS